MKKTTLEKLIKCRESLVSHVMRGNRISEKNQRSLDLIDRYSELEELARSEGVWKEFCRRYGYSESHDVYDYFA